MRTVLILVLLARSSTALNVHSNCTLPGRVCLVGGDDRHEGNVYIGLGSGISKPVCDDHWDIKDGLVVCRELGYVGIVKVKSPPYLSALCLMVIY